MEEKYSKKQSFVDYLVSNIEISEEEPANHVLDPELSSEEITQKFHSLAEEIDRIKNLALDSRLQVDKLADKIEVESQRNSQSEELSIVKQPDRGSEARANFFDEENLKLKQDNFNLLRRYNEVILKRANQAESFSSSDGLSLPSSEQPSFFVDQIQKIEAKKEQLLRDNIEINNSAEEVLEENRALKRKIEALKKQNNN